MAFFSEDGRPRAVFYGQVMTCRSSASASDIWVLPTRLSTVHILQVPPTVVGRKVLSIRSCHPESLSP